MKIQVKGFEAMQAVDGSLQKPTELTHNFLISMKTYGQYFMFFSPQNIIQCAIIFLHLLYEVFNIHLKTEHLL